MAASEREPHRRLQPDAARRDRFERSPAHAPAVVSPAQVEILGTVKQAGVIDLFGLATAHERSPKQMRRAVRPLFDGGYLSIIPVTRASLADVGSEAGPELLLGSAANVYTLTRAGERLLARSEGIEVPPKRPLAYSVRQSPFIAHELQVAAVYGWLRRLERHGGERELVRWVRAAEAVIDLKRHTPAKSVRPDAWFVLRIGANHLVAFVEVDRGTEGVPRWRQKLAAYRALFTSGRVPEVCGFQKARVLVLAPNGRRREALAQLIASEAEPALADLFWLAERAVLATPALELAAWQRPGRDGLSPLLSLNPLPEGQV